MHYDVSHRTHIVYDSTVQSARFNLRLLPVDWLGQTLLDHCLTIDPVPTNIRTTAGPYLANITRVVIQDTFQELRIESRFRMEVKYQPPVADADDVDIAAVVQAAIDVQDIGPMAPANFIYGSPLAPIDRDIAKWASDELRPDRNIFQAAMAITNLIHGSFRFDPEATEADTPMAAAFARRHGVCQDFSHIMIAALRSAGLAAAYVSGYLRTAPPPGSPRLVGADASHAWVLVWCGRERGWLGFDPTNGCPAGSDHIVIAVGRDYSDVSPINGVFLGHSAQRVTVEVDVIPIGSSDGSCARNPAR